MLETAINYWPVGVLGHVYSRVSPYDHTLKGQKPNEDEIQIRLGFDALMGLERPIGLDLRWGLGAAHLKGAPKVGPTRAHLVAPIRAIKGGERGRGRPIPAALAAPLLAPSSLSLLLRLPRIKP